MSYRVHTGLYTVERHHHRYPWQFPWTPTTEGPGYPPNDGTPPDPRSTFGYPKGPTRPTPGSSRRRHKRRWD